MSNEGELRVRSTETQTKTMSGRDRRVRRRVSWSDLPRELLESIVSRLKPNSDDLRLLRCVCKRWRSSIDPPPLRLSPELPQQVSTLTYPSRLVAPAAPFTIVATAVYLLRPPLLRPPRTGWLVAVEQSSLGKVRLLHPLTRLPVKTLPENFPKVLPNLSALEISTGYNLRLSDGVSPLLEHKRKAFSANKVLFWPSPYYKSPSIQQSSLALLHDTGDLVCIQLKDSYRKKISYGSVSKFDDIVIRNGMLMAVNRGGRLYGIEYDWMDVTTVLIAKPTFKGHNERRKRLVMGNHNLYLVVRDQTKFEVYVINWYQCVWNKATSLDDRVLFVSIDTCFFVPAKDLPGNQRNCIVFSKDCFPNYSRTNKTDDSLFKAAETNEYFEVGVSKYGKAKNFKLISACPGFSDALWPPPEWISEEASKSHKEYAHEEEDETDTMPGVASVVPSTDDHSTTQFQGVDVRTNLVPILEKIWAKHGDILDGSIVRYRGNVGRVLESLAEMVLLLLQSSGKLLHNTQADDLRAALLDLQQMRFKVDWLVPFAEKALACDGNKPADEKTSEHAKAIDVLGLGEYLGVDSC